MGIEEDLDVLHFLKLLIFSIFLLICFRMWVALHSLNQKSSSYFFLCGLCDSWHLRLGSGCMY